MKVTGVVSKYGTWEKAGLFVERDRYRLPELEGGVWVNTPPLTAERLRGRVVLVDFWDYTCINCIRTLPYLVEWYRRYEPLGLTVVGVHAPEFPFSAETGNVLRAIERFGINYPVVLDNDYALWRAFSNRYWPAKYLADKDGFIRYVHFGEGNYAECEMAIQLLLREISPEAPMPDIMRPIRDTDIPGIHCYRPTPELYFGSARSPLEATDDGPVRFELPERLEEDRIYLEGSWEVKPHYARPLPPRGVSASVHVICSASEVNVVVNPLEERGFKVRVEVDSAPVASDEAGADVEVAEDGSTLLTVSEPRMYNVVRSGEFKKRRLTLRTESPSCALYAFTFVGCPV